MKESTRRKSNKQKIENVLENRADGVQDQWNNGILWDRIVIYV